MAENWHYDDVIFAGSVIEWYRVDSCLGLVRWHVQLLLRGGCWPCDCLQRWHLVPSRQHLSVNLQGLTDPMNIAAGLAGQRLMFSPPCGIQGMQFIGMEDLVLGSFPVMCSWFLGQQFSALHEVQLSMGICGPILHPKLCCRDSSKAFGLICSSLVC